jgi:phage baseplate assembly protein W
MAKIFSTEDGNLSTSLRVTKERKYSDIDLSLSARTSTDGDVYRKTDASAVKQAVKNLLLTSKFEKPYRPQFGANLNSLLFENMDEDVGDEIIENIRSAIERFEPRARVVGISVSATPDFNYVDATIEFRVVNTNVVDVLKVTLTPSTQASVADIPVLPVTDRNVTPTYFNVIFTEREDRIQTIGGSIITQDTIEIPDLAILTEPDSDLIHVMYLGTVEGVLLRDSAELGGILTVPDENQIFTQTGGFFIIPNQSLGGEE